MSLGDTQEVVIAYVAGISNHRLGSISVMKYYAQVVRNVYPHTGFLAQFGEEELPKPPPVPQDYALRQNFPNPFNPSTEIEYSIPIDAAVKLTVYDLLGRELRVFHQGNKRAGTYKVTWDGKDASGQELRTGVYFYRLEAGHVQLAKKMMLVR